MTVVGTLHTAPALSQLGSEDGIPEADYHVVGNNFTLSPSRHRGAKAAHHGISRDGLSPGKFKTRDARELRFGHLKKNRTSPGKRDRTQSDENPADWARIMEINKKRIEEHSRTPSSRWGVP